MTKTTTIAAICGALLIGLSSGIVFTIKSISEIEKAPKISTDYEAENSYHGDRLRNLERYLSSVPFNTANIENRSEERQDKFHDALSQILVDTNVAVIQIDELTRTPAGELLVDCLDATKPREIKMAERLFGIDIFADARRIAIADDFVLIDGDFGGSYDNEVDYEIDTRSYGDLGTIFSMSRSVYYAWSRGAIWNDEFLVLSNDIRNLREVIDICEGRRSTETKTDRFINRKGEVYGYTELEGLIDLVKPLHLDAHGVELLKENVRQVGVDVETTRGFILTINLEVGDSNFAKIVSNLVKTFLAKTNASGTMPDDNPLGEILDSARVFENSETVQIELMIPYEIVESEFANCNVTEAVQDLRPPEMSGNYFDEELNDL